MRYGYETEPSSARETFVNLEACERRRQLRRIADGIAVIDDYSNDELLRLGIGYGVAGPLSDEQVRREAAEILEDEA